MVKNQENRPETERTYRAGTVTKLLLSLFLFLLTAVFLLSAAASVIALNSNYFRGGSPDAQINYSLYDLLCNVTRRDLSELAWLKHASYDGEGYQSEYARYRQSYLESCYTEEVSNVLYRITTPDGKLLGSNFAGDLPTYLCHYEYHSTIDKTDNEAIENNAFIIDAYIKSELTARDSIYYLKEIHLAIYHAKYLSVILTVISFLLCAALLILLCIIAGKRKGEQSPRVGFLDRIPLELVIAAFLFLLVLVAVFINDVIYYTPFYYSYTLCLILLLCIYSALFIFTLYLCLTLSVRCKTKTLLKSTLCYRILALLCRGCKKLWALTSDAAGDKKGFVKNILIILSCIVCDVFSCLLLLHSYDLGILLGIAVWGTKTVLLAVLLLRNSFNLRVLSVESRKIVDGDLESKISYAKLGSEYKELAVNFNHISDGLSTALEKQVKSERMKTELITNVSHDIKTPLTCIINYVDLLKGQPLESEKAREYVDVLDKQSARLKKLIEDLIETSKAASGSIPVTPQQTDVGILLSQAAGEYRDRFESAGLEVVAQFPHDALTAYCDPRLCWRVFDNLFSNVAKYGMPATRVYLSAAEAPRFVTVTLKNISKNQLNVSPDELTERFVRGDVSRNTEGSGLGLSIAKSLAELQGGSLDIEIDGDMFKAIVTIPKA